MRYTVIVLSVLVLMGSIGDVEAKKRKKQDIVVVLDYTGTAWDGMIQQTVNEFNAVLPKGGPSLRYRRMHALSCEEIKPSKRRDMTIKVCSLPALYMTNLDGTQTEMAGGAPDFRDIWLSDRYVYAGQNISCHEFMHVLTGVHDNPEARPNDSCVWGRLSAPGAFDVALLHQKHGH